MSKLPACAAVPSFTPSSTSTPKPRDLRDPLLLVLGQMTDFKAGIFVDKSLVTDAVIMEAGFDPKNLPDDRDRYSRANDGEGGGIDRNIQLTFRYGYRDHTPPLTQRGPQKALWGLADAGVARALDLAAPKPLPQSRTFAEPMLRAMGKLSGHTQEPATRQMVMEATLQEAGYNPRRPPRGWMDPSSNNKPKIHEVLRWVARSMSTLITMPARGMWALTPLGLAKAAQYNSVTLAPEVLVPVVQEQPTGPNATAQWLAQHLRPAKNGKDSELMCLMRGALIRHLPVSSRHGMIDDHIQNFMVRVIHRDSFAPALAAGDGIPYSKVASYCVNSGRTDARTMGTEPVCREFMGARTDKERHTPDDVADENFFMPDNNAMKDVYDTDGNLAVQVTEYAEGHPSDSQAYDDLWGKIEAVIQERKPGAWERYTHMLKMKADGFSTQEIADKEGVSRPRAAKMLATVRQFVWEACNGPDRVLAY